MEISSVSSWWVSNHIWLPDLWVNPCQVETSGFTCCLKVFNIWLHLLEGVTVYLDVQSRLLTLPWVYGAARWADIWGILFWHAVPDRLQRLSASVLWSAIAVQLVVGFFFRPNPFGTELQVHCYSVFPACWVIKCGKTGEFPPSWKGFCNFFEKSWPILCVPSRNLPVIERRGQQWAPEEPQ